MQKLKIHNNPTRLTSGNFHHFLFGNSGTWIFLCLFFIPIVSISQSDTSHKKHQEPEHFGHQLRLDLDLSRPVINQTQSTHTSYEAAIDYYIKNEVYAVAEGGFGSAVYDYPDLSYKSNSSFFRIGLDKTLIKRINNNDWDVAFMGIRYGAAFINRQEAKYAIIDSVWGTVSGIIPAKSFVAHWAEITGGIKVELLKGLMVGWNIRGRFLLNEKAFRELSPVYIAGYGKGDKTSVFDFNFYLCYAVRWGSKDIKKATDK